MRIVDLPANFVKFSIGSKRSPLLAVAVVSVMAILLAVPVFVAKRSSAHGVNPAKKKQQGCCANQPAIFRRMIGTYYTTGDGFKSILILNNKGPGQIAVTPILHSQNGQAFTASPVAIDGQSSSEVDLNLLATIAGPQFRSGSFEFTYEGRLLEMGGGLRIINAEKSLIFDEQMLEPGMKFSSPQLEAVYAVPFEDSQVSVIVTNTTALPILVNGDAIFAGVNGHHPIQDQLGPYQTQVVNLPRGLVRKTSAGAVSLSHNGGKGALLAIIHIQDADRGYSEAVNFNDPTHGKTAQLHGAGLRLGSINGDALSPVIAVRNIGDDATNVTASVPYSKQNGSTGKISLPRLSLAPGEIKLIDTSNLQLRQDDFDTAGLEIEYKGASGSVIASAHSESVSGNQVFVVPLKDPQGGLSSTGGYPWFIKESSSTVVFIKNVTKEEQVYMLNIIYPGGRWGTNARTIAPGKTIAIDVRKLRDTQERGAEDNVIPITATTGHISWSFRGKQDKVLIGRAQTVDFSNGLASTYECQCTCGWTYAGFSQLEPNNKVTFVGFTEFFQPQSAYNDCYGSYQGIFNVDPFTVFFWSENTSVASINSGTATANGPGSTILHAEWTERFYRCYPDPYSCSSCVSETESPSVTAQIKVIRATLNAVGFKNDYQITKWPAGPVIDNPDGTSPTWTSGGVDDPAAYKAVYDTPRMFATFEVTTPQSYTANIRVKNGSTIIATKNGVTLSGGSIRIDDIDVTEALSDSVRTTTPTFTWEISVEPYLWYPIGTSGPHKMYWTADVPLPDPFQNFAGTVYPQLYDKALDKACGYVGGMPDIRARVAAGVSADTEITYDPSRLLAGHPLNAYGSSCLCSDYAALLRGLLRSIGIDGTVKYMWAGESSTSLKGYNLLNLPTECSGGSGLDFCISIRVLRPAKGAAPLNPHFSYHAAVDSGGLLYDAVYGDSYTSPSFDETAYGSTPTQLQLSLFTSILRTTFVCPHTEP
jgi:hypothetical protein